MEIIKNADGTSLKLSLDGRLDTMTAPQLESEIKASCDGVTSLVLDFEKLSYVSSAGLRVILGAQKIMNKQGEMKIINVNQDIMEVFEITGFSDILAIE